MDGIAFTKYQAGGNDFIIFDNRFPVCTWHDSDWIKRLCDRHRGIGADGLIFLGSSENADYAMRIFNSDGSEPAMCGNGILCLFSFIQVLGDARTDISIETKAGIMKCRSAEEGRITVNLGVPKVIYWPIDSTEGKLFVVDTGVRHAVLFVESLERVNVSEMGRKIRSLAQFLPEGVNVNFVTVLAPGKLKIRTYEMGIEAETFSCGTGAAAAAFVASQLLGFSAPVNVFPFSRGEEDMIAFHFHSSDSGSYEIEMTGRAASVFEGTIPIHTTSPLRT